MPLQSTVAAPLTDQDRAAIRSRIAKFDRDVLAGNAPAIASAYTEDAVLLPPNAPMVKGRQAIQEFFKELPKFTKFTESPIEVEGEGDYAFPWGTYESVDATGVKDHGKVLAVWHRQPDGTWLVGRVCCRIQPLAQPPVAAGHDRRARRRHLTGQHRHVCRRAPRPDPRHPALLRSPLLSQGGLPVPGRRDEHAHPCP